MAASSSSIRSCPFSALPPECTFVCIRDPLLNWSADLRYQALDMSMRFLKIALEVRTKPSNTYEIGCTSDSGYYIKRARTIVVNGCSKPETKVMLGYQRYLDKGFWYTQLEKDVGLAGIIQNISPFTKKEKPRAEKFGGSQFFENMGFQDGSCFILQQLRFAPPAIVCNDYDIPAFPDDAKFLPSTSGVVAIDSDVLDRMVTGNSGLFFGHVHEQLHSCVGPWLTRSMERFARLGVRHIYLEVSAAEMHTVCEKFNADLANAEEELEKNFESLFMKDISAWMEICRAARDHKIQVRCVNASVCYAPGQTITKQGIIEERDVVMAKNILYHSAKLKPGEKYIALMGLAHFELATRFLHIPHLRIADEIDVPPEYEHEAPATAGASSTMPSTATIPMGIDPNEILTFVNFVFPFSQKEIEAMFLSKPDYFVLLNRGLLCDRDSAKTMRRDSVKAVR